MAALTAALVGLTAAQSIAGYGAARSAGRAARQQGEYESKIYGVNADLAESQAEDAIARGHEASNRLRTQGKTLMGTQRATYAASGVDPTVGTARAVQAETESLTALDRLTIENNAAREAYGFRTQAAGYRMQGSLARTAGRNQQRAANMQGYSTLLGGAADIAHIYYKNR